MTATKSPLLTVIIPTRHRDDSLALCLNQLFGENQSVTPDLYEVFVTDDGSTSTAEAMIHRDFPTVHWLQGPRRGPAANRNHGARHGSAPWLVFTDDDCVPSPGWLKAFVDAVRADEAAGRVSAIYEGRTTCAAGIATATQHAPINETGGWLWSCNMMIRRETYQALKGFDEEFPFAHMEDVDFRERAHGIGAAMRFVPDAVVDHPPREENLGEKIAPSFESEYMMYYKIGETGDYRIRQLRRLVSTRLRKYWQYRSDPASLALLRSLFIEVMYVLKRAPAWQRKYQERYRNVDVPYKDDVATRLHFRA